MTNGCCLIYCTLPAAAFIPNEIGKSDGLVGSAIMLIHTKVI